MSGTTPEEFMHSGIPVAMISGPRSHTFENWVQALAESSGRRVDWRQIGGRQIVLVLAADDVAHVRAEMVRMWDALLDAYMTCTDNFVADPDRRDVKRCWVGPDLEVERSLGYVEALTYTLPG